MSLTVEKRVGNFPWEKEYLEGTEDFIFPNTFKTMRQYLSVIGENGTKCEFEIYHVGMINNVALLVKEADM